MRKTECKFSDLRIDDNELYDFTAGKLIVREAGGLVTDFAGNIDHNDQNSRFLASNGTSLHQRLLQIC